MAPFMLLAGLASLVHLQFGLAGPVPPSSLPYCPVFYTEPPRGCVPLPETFLITSSNSSEYGSAEVEILEQAVEALVVMQERFFDSDYSTWPSAIDWTAAVAGTIISGMLTTMSRSLPSVDMGGLGSWKAKENLISAFYAQVVGSYYGQDVLSIRGQAYDDILWVVLGWIETINFVKTHASLHYPRDGREGGTVSGGLRQMIDSIPWHGHNWVCSFAHRARIFWNLGSRGWGTGLCEGGMVWNPRLNPYKNAITNELWISASISMYHNFPGDNFTAPWLADVAFPTKDPRHLQAAIEGYGWLMNVNMTNKQGLFVDGYHIDKNIPGNTACDLRDEMVYTYNQGVVLTGQRGLWAVSGSASYLEDGHSLIQSVIAATGWDLQKNGTVDDLDSIQIGSLPPWRGLGRAGIMEEQCDASGTCSQDGQVFKGIFFHHLTAFCARLDPASIEEGVTVDMRRFNQVQAAHAVACKSYLNWVRHNTLAALKTRDEAGVFGMWWGAGLFNVVVTRDEDGIDHEAENTTDYRNQGTPEDETWGEHRTWAPGTGGWHLMEEDPLLELEPDQTLMGRQMKGKHPNLSEEPASPGVEGTEDPNGRGRGRTIETQMGGLALLRAYWEMSR